MTTLRATGATAEAARVLIEGSALGRVLDDFGTVDVGPGVVNVDLPAPYAALLSSGERLLWDALAALSGPGGGVDVWSCAATLDEPSARALADAVGIALGVTEKAGRG
jgi:hypothetical protein